MERPPPRKTIEDLRNTVDKAQRIAQVPSDHPAMPTSPLSLGCPHCGADPKKDCQKTRGEFAKVHLARIRAAAALDRRKRNKGIARGLA